VAFSFFDIIDWIVPGDFPGWVYVAENAVWAAIGIFALVTLIKKSCKRHQANQPHCSGRCPHRPSPKDMTFDRF
jgi:hypothetical protein